MAANEGVPCEPHEWSVVCQSQNNSLVLYSSSLQEIRTVTETKSNPLPVPWTSPAYFEILAKFFEQKAAASLQDSLLNGYFDMFFPRREKIGSGGCGSVYRVEHVLAGIKLAVYAVKVIPFGDATRLKRAINEVKLFEKMGRQPHPLIIGYKHCWIENWQPANFGPTVPCLFILMEYAPLGTVEKWLADGEKPGVFKKLPDRQLWQIFVSIATAVHHLHSIGIMHRDLKLSNVLMFEAPKNSPTKLRLVLSDFGTSVDVFDLGLRRPRTGATGTIETMAPELLKTDDDGTYMYSHSFQSDVWSLGVILFSLFYRCNPFVMDGGEERLMKYVSVDALVKEMGLENVKVPRLARKLMDRMMRANPAERCTIEELMEEPEIFQMTVEFGLDKLVRMDGPTVMVSPSMEDLVSSVALPLPEGMHETKAIQTDAVAKFVLNPRNVFGLMLVPQATSFARFLTYFALLALSPCFSSDVLWCGAVIGALLHEIVINKSTTGVAIGLLLVFGYLCLTTIEGGDTTLRSGKDLWKKWAKWIRGVFGCLDKNWMA